MNLLRYITVILMAQTVQCNTIGQRFTANNTRTDQRSSDRQNQLSTQDNSEVVSRRLVIVEDSPEPDNEPMTSSDIFLRSVTSPKFDLVPLTRVRRRGSPRKKNCGARPENCRKGKKGWKQKKCKVWRRCRKGRGRGNRNRRGRGGRNSPRSTPKPPPINNPTQGTGREECIRSKTDCPAGHCCARHHSHRVCKPMKREGDICTRPKRKEKRNADRYGLCECEDGLVCKRSQDRNTNSRLFTCQRNT